MLILYLAFAVNLFKREAEYKTLYAEFVADKIQFKGDGLKDLMLDVERVKKGGNTMTVPVTNSNHNTPQFEAVLEKVASNPLTANHALRSLNAELLKNKATVYVNYKKKTERITELTKQINFLNTKIEKHIAADPAYNKVYEAKVAHHNRLMKYVKNIALTALFLPYIIYPIHKSLFGKPNINRLGTTLGAEKKKSNYGFKQSYNYVKGKSSTAWKTVSTTASQAWAKTKKGASSVKQRFTNKAPKPHK